MTRCQLRKRYAILRSTMPLLARCGVCQMMSCTKYMDAHHLQGRGCDGMLLFVMMHRKCHDFCHQNPKWAREHKFIVYSYELERRQHECFGSLQRGESTFVDTGTLEEARPSGGTGEEVQEPIQG